MPTRGGDRRVCARLKLAETTSSPGFRMRSEKKGEAGRDGTRHWVGKGREGEDLVYPGSSSSVRPDCRRRGKTRVKLLCGFLHLGRSRRRSELVVFPLS